MSVSRSLAVGASLFVHAGVLAGVLGAWTAPAPTQRAALPEVAIELAAVSTAGPEAQVTPNPEPAPAPEPVPEPLAEPDPVSQPEPEPVPKPEPEPEPAPRPKPIPKPKPAAVKKAEQRPPAVPTPAEPQAHAAAAGRQSASGPVGAPAPLSQGQIDARLRELAASSAYQPLEKTPPAYPPRALQQRIQGECTVAYTVGIDGRVQEPRIVGECHPLLRRPSLQAAQTFRYRPHRIEGRAVAVPGVRNTFVYRIQPGQG